MTNKKTNKVKDFFKKKFTNKRIKGESFKGILTGDILNPKYIKKHFLLIVFIICLTLVYMDNRMRCEHQFIKIEELQKELTYEIYSCLNTEVDLIKASRIGEIEEKIKYYNLDLQEATLPPFKVNK
jgi:hypothetical protein